MDSHYITNVCQICKQKCRWNKEYDCLEAKNLPVDPKGQAVSPTIDNPLFFSCGQFQSPKSSLAFTNPLCDYFEHAGTDPRDYSIELPANSTTTLPLHRRARARAFHDLHASLPNPPSPIPQCLALSTPKMPKTSP